MYLWWAEVRQGWRPQLRLDKRVSQSWSQTAQRLSLINPVEKV